MTSASGAERFFICLETTSLPFDCSEEHPLDCRPRSRPSLAQDERTDSPSKALWIIGHYGMARLANNSKLALRENVINHSISDFRTHDIRGRTANH